MYMDGFHWIHDTTCVIYLAPEGVLSSRGRFAAAVIGTIVFGALLEFVIYQRRRAMVGASAGYSRLAASAVFYGGQLTLGYLLMLVVMTYSGPLFASVVLGIVLGHVLFNARDAILVDNISNNNGKGGSGKKKQQTDGTPIEPSSTDLELEGSGGDLTVPENDVQHGDRPHCCSGGASESDDDEKDEGNGVPEGATPCCQNVL